nr:hypothetical protein [uncultured Nocardioides sp.]
MDYGGGGGSYDENLATYSAAGWQVAPAAEWAEALGRLDPVADGGQRRVLIDISSMPRTVLADIVERLSVYEVPLLTTFVYAPGVFEHSVRAAGRTEVLTAGPISPFFAGELRPTSVPIGLIVGLGLEQHRAVGVMELLEPANTWIFTTYSGDQRFRDAAERVHRRLLEVFDPASVFEYDLRSIGDTFSALESLTFSAGLRYRLIMAPSGPKVFALACLLVAAGRSAARPAVWRVGGADPSEAYDVAEAGDLVAAQVTF